MARDFTYCRKVPVHDSILDMTSFSSTVHICDQGCDSVQNGVGQFNPIFQIEGNTFRPIVLVIS